MTYRALLSRGWCESADRALYAAKRNSRNQSVTAREAGALSRAFQLGRHCRLALPHRNGRIGRMGRLGRPFG